jgi:deoxyribose-phosphate aldolase
LNQSKISLLGFLFIRVREAVEALTRFKAPQIPVAAVATGFPSGQYSLATRLEEIKFAIQEGASEIDIVINRTLALQVLFLMVTLKI